MRRQFLGWLAATCAAAAMAALPAAASAQAKTIKMATIAIHGSPWHKALMKFKEVVDKESHGKYTVSIYTDGQLGDIPQLLSAMQIGTVDMGYFGLSSISFVKGGEPLNIIYVPYLFKNGEWAEKILNNDEFNGIYDKVAQTSGVRVFGAWGQRSARAIQTIKGPIRTPEDLRGMRLRIPTIPILKAAFDRIGVQVTPMGMLEIYNALSRGMVDGQDNGFDLAMPAKYYEAAKYWSATDHVYEIVGFFVSERLWKKMSDEDRAMFKKASQEAGTVATELTRQFDKDSIDVLKKAGATYVVPDKAAFRKAFEGVEAPYDGKLWPKGMVERIHQIQGDK
jgi:tripartite ATP-independent transporter DctP family solute receptor